MTGSQIKEDSVSKDNYGNKSELSLLFCDSFVMYCNIYRDASFFFLYWKRGNGTPLLVATLGNTIDKLKESGRKKIIWRFYLKCTKFKMFCNRFHTLFLSIWLEFVWKFFLHYFFKWVVNKDLLISSFIINRWPLNSS